MLADIVAELHASLAQGPFPDDTQLLEAYLAAKVKRPLLNASHLHAGITTQQAKIAWLRLKHHDAPDTPLAQIAYQEAKLEKLRTFRDIDIICNYCDKIEEDHPEVMAAATTVSEELLKPLVIKYYQQFIQLCEGTECGLAE
jgi:hypothetical protein